MTDAAAWIKKQLKSKTRRRKAKTKAKPVAKVDYGRRVRNVHDGVGLTTKPVVPHSGPKPHQYPKVDWTPHAWRTL